MNKIVNAAIAACAYAGLLAAAHAADMPAQTSAEAPAAGPFAWNGCYIGAHGGYGWGRTRRHDLPTVLTDHQHVDGGLGGGQIGCNVQRGPWTFGVEGQTSWADIGGVSSVLADLPIGSQAHFHTDIDFLGSIVGRVGRSFDRTLLYATGGVAFARQKHWQSLDNVPVYISERYTRWGWTAGGGIEQALSAAWSARVEYSYIHFGTDSARFCETGGGFCAIEGNSQYIHLVKVGVNYRFGAGPVSRRVPF